MIPEFASVAGGSSVIAVARRVAMSEHGSRSWKLEADSWLLTPDP